MPKKTPAPPCPFIAEAEQLKAAKEVISGYVRLWIVRLGLEHWSLKQEFHTGTCEDSPGCAACAHSDWKYKHGGVEFFLGVMVAMPPEDQEMVVIHELMHIVLGELHGVKEKISEEDRAHEERVVTELTQAFLRCTRRG